MRSHLHKRFALGAISFHVLHHFDKVDVVLIEIGLVLLLTFLFAVKLTVSYSKVTTFV